MKKIEVLCEDEFYDQVTGLFKELGLDVNTAVNIFLHQSLLQQGIPFYIRVNPNQPPVYDTMMENPIINDLTF